MMRKGSVNKTRRRNSDAEEWHDCMGVPSEYQYITDDNSSPETIRRVNSVRNSAWKAPTQSKAKTTRNREVPPLIYQEHTAQSNEDFNVFLENLETINNANDYENLLTEIYTEKPKRGRKKKSIVTPSSDSLLAVECLKNNEIINNTKVTVKRTNSKLSAVNKPDSIELEEVINTLGNVSQQAGVGDKPKTTYKPRKTKPKDVVDMPVSELLQNENGSSLLNETLTVNKPLKATKPRKSKQNMIFETPLPSECHSTTNMLDAANITENETELKCKGRTSRKREKTDSPSVSKEPSHAECTSLEDESEKIIASAFSENASSNDSSPISPFSPEIDELNLDNFKWKRKLPEHETSTPKRDKQTGKAPSSAARYRRGVFNITVKKGLPIEVDVNCKIPTYITNSRESRGNVLVISNIQFMDPEKNRKGGDIDHTNITKLFKEMGFTITSHKNKTAKVR